MANQRIFELGTIVGARKIEVITIGLGKVKDLGDLEGVVGLSNICHTLLINIAVEIPFMIHKLYNAVNSKYFSFGLFQFNGFIGKLLYSLDQCLSFSLKSSKLTNILL